MFYEQEQFKCESFDSPKRGKTSALMVSLCPKTWVGKETKQLCEDKYSDNISNILLAVPVQSSDNNITFRNMYCAYCNNVFEFRYFTFENVCLGNINITSCILFHYQPISSSILRGCGKSAIRVISTCFKSDSFKANQSQLLNNLCQSESVSVVFDEYNFNAYKNKFCAMCNEIDEKNLLCSPVSNTIIESKIMTYSYRMIVDLNLRQVQTVHDFKDHQKMIDSSKMCSNADDEIYDPVSLACRKLYCPPMSIATEGKCELINQTTNNQQHVRNKCTFLKLDPSEYIILNSTSIYLLLSNRTVDSSKFIVNNSNVYMCIKIPSKRNSLNYSIVSDIVESYLSLVGLSFSIIALAVTLTVYMMFSELRNTPGKNLISLMIALLSAQLLFAFSKEAYNNKLACKAMAICIHYFFLASFSWMNVITLDLFITFSQSRILSSNNSKIFYKYSVYAWLLPAIVVFSALILEYLCSDDNKYKPRYGDTVCWISSKNALLLFFLGPLAVFKLCDVAGFICTSFHISSSRRQTSFARHYTFCSCLLYLKLSFVMGLTWLFAFIGVLSNNIVVWYLFIIFNTLQGVFIGISFLTTKRTITLIKAKIRILQTNRSTSRGLTTKDSSC
ncbi:G-protein coupled receptor Mth2-like [Ruditapes philippinarum]|uniref:G-protein coupled receptor Mth2-like n=1 Tax=Ruditapes philippinarum TaxID=129788 RepID=UPI00295AE490|nr:G-protein coupled receptor Mth2-like [Ruditapes philippinarum]